MAPWLRLLQASSELSSQAECVHMADEHHDSLTKATDGFGAVLQRRLDALERGAARRPLGPLLFGVCLALVVIAGGLALFIVTWAVLIGLAA
jgi:hypothetical protein